MGNMSKIVVSEFVTLDGVAQDPGGVGEIPEGGWAFKFERGPEGDRFKLDEVLAAGALLLGRRTYEGFADAWPSRTGEFADKMNTMPKYVVSSTLTNADWSNSTIISDDVADRIRELTHQVNGDILVAGSTQLLQTLVEHDLVDEYRLMVYPTVLGAGRPLFPPGGKATDLRIAESGQLGETVLLICHPARERGPSCA
jgi:dihydrofolate reductase